MAELRVKDRAVVAPARSSSLSTSDEGQETLTQKTASAARDALSELDASINSMSRLSVAGTMTVCSSTITPVFYPDQSKSSPESANKAEPMDAGLALDMGVLRRRSWLESAESEIQLKRDKLARFEVQCSRILDFLYLGGDQVARDLGILRASGITHVLNCVGFCCPEYFPQDFVYKTLWLEDNTSQDIIGVLYDVFDFIEDVRRSEGRVLVHCSHGVSRSASLVIAYLMWHKTLTFEEALRQVRLVRGVASPNMGFACQLLQWQRRILPPSVLRLAASQSLRNGGLLAGISAAFSSKRDDQQPSAVASPAPASSPFPPSPSFTASPPLSASPQFGGLAPLRIQSTGLTPRGRSSGRAATVAGADAWGATASALLRKSSQQASPRGTPSGAPGAHRLLPRNGFAFPPNSGQRDTPRQPFQAELSLGVAGATRKPWLGGAAREGVDNPYGTPFPSTSRQVWPPAAGLLPLAAAPEDEPMGAAEQLGAEGRADADAREVFPTKQQGAERMQEDAGRAHTEPPVERGSEGELPLMFPLLQTQPPSFGAASAAPLPPLAPLRPPASLSPGSLSSRSSALSSCGAESSASDSSSCSSASGGVPSESPPADDGALLPAPLALRLREAPAAAPPELVGLPAAGSSSSSSSKALWGGMPDGQHSLAAATPRSPPSPLEPPLSSPLASRPPRLLLRMAPQSRHDPAHLVPRQVPCSATSLDPRGAFLLQLGHRVVLWRGAACPPAMLVQAQHSAEQLLRYERLRGPVVAVREGEEPPAVLRALRMELAEQPLALSLSPAGLAAAPLVEPLPAAGAPGGEAGAGAGLRAPQAAGSGEAEAHRRGVLAEGQQLEEGSAGRGGFDAGIALPAVLGRGDAEGNMAWGPAAASPEAGRRSAWDIRGDSVISTISDTYMLEEEGEEQGAGTQGSVIPLSVSRVSEYDEDFRLFDCVLTGRPANMRAHSSSQVAASGVERNRGWLGGSKSQVVA